MLIVNISGGLGNQLFQLAFYNKLKKQHSNIFINIDFYTNQKKTLFSLFRVLKSIPIRKFHFFDNFRSDIISLDNIISEYYKFNIFKLKFIRLASFFVSNKILYSLLNIKIINENS